MTDSLIEKYDQYNHFGKFIGMNFNILSEGIVENTIIIKKDHLATPNAAHGGVVSALIDGAIGIAGLSSVYKENKVVSTIEFKLNFISPVILNDALVATARVEQK